MPKIDFYILTESSCLPFACRLIEKIYKNQHRIYIHTNNQKEAYELDELLWTYKDSSFIPHNLYNEGPDPAPPVQIGFAVTPEKQRDVLINLSDHIPEFFLQFSRVIELVSNDTEKQNRARENYRLYKTRGYDITTHKLPAHQVS